MIKNEKKNKMSFSSNNLQKVRNYGDEAGRETTVREAWTVSHGRGAAAAGDAAQREARRDASHPTVTHHENENSGGTVNMKITHEENAVRESAPRRWR